MALDDRAFEGQIRALCTQLDGPGGGAIKCARGLVFIATVADNDVQGLLKKMMDKCGKMTSVIEVASSQCETWECILAQCNQNVNPPPNLQNLSVLNIDQLCVSLLSLVCSSVLWPPLWKAHTENQKQKGLVLLQCPDDLQVRITGVNQNWSAALDLLKRVSQWATAENCIQMQLPIDCASLQRFGFKSSGFVWSSLSSSKESHTRAARALLKKSQEAVNSGPLLDEIHEATIHIPFDEDKSKNAPDGLMMVLVAIRCLLNANRVSTEVQSKLDEDGRKGGDVNLRDAIKYAEYTKNAANSAYSNVVTFKIQFQFEY